MKKLIRDNVLRIEQYEPGKSIEVIRREVAVGREISKLASNENPLGPSPLAIRTIKKCLGDGNLYPDNTSHCLRERIGHFLGISPSNLAVGNGTTELIFLMGLAFLNPKETFIMSQCSFIMGKIVAQVMDSQLKEVPLKDYRHDLPAILERINSDTKIIYLDNPMNPIGTVINHEEVDNFMKKIPDDIIVAFDEAYYEYASRKNYPDTLKYIEEGRNVIVFRTFSKLYGLAGLRIGYCIAKEDLIEAIKKISPPFAVNRFAQIGAAAALNDRQHIQRTKDVNTAGKKFLYENFEEMSVFYIPSETNFVTIDLKADAESLCNELQKRGVIVRPLTMYGKPTFVRVTIGSPEQNKRFMKTFKKIYQGSGRNS